MTLYYNFSVDIYRRSKNLYRQSKCQYFSIFGMPKLHCRSQKNYLLSLQIHFINISEIKFYQMGNIIQLKKNKFKKCIRVIQFYKSNSHPVIFQTNNLNKNIQEQENKNKVQFVNIINILLYTCHYFSRLTSVSDFRLFIV